MVLRKGSTGSLVKYLQRLLNWQGNALTVDGDIGTNTYNAVRAFQTNHGLEVDGIVGTNTWARLLKSHVIDVEGVGPTKLVNVAKFELSWGFTEDNNDDKTPYGEWYGQNGSPWSGMFISWCARHSGTLNSLVPRFSDCPAGVAWYQSKGRFHSAGTERIGPLSQKPCR